MELSETLSRSTTLVDFSLARSDFLDSFADLEAAIWVKLEKSGMSPIAREPFGNRLKAFRELPSGSQIAKCRINQRNQLADAVAKILPIRADLVHGRMRIAILDGEAVAMFTNATLAGDEDAPVRILTLARMRSISERLQRHTQTVGLLSKPVNPPSSPPPPSQDAAVDP